MLKKLRELRNLLLKSIQFDTIEKNSFFYQMHYKWLFKVVSFPGQVVLFTKIYYFTASTKEVDYIILLYYYMYMSK